MRKLTLLIIMSCLLWSGAARADIPKYLTYQAKLTDTQGTPVSDGSYVITFRFHDAQTGGSVLWTETQAVTITDGEFTVILGSVTPLNLAFDQPYWLSVEVQGDEEMRPRTRLTSAGYAINADKLDDVTSAQFLRSDADNTTSGQITFAYPGTALVIQPASAPGDNTKLFEIKNVSGTQVYSIDYEGDLISQNAAVGGNLDVAGTGDFAGTLNVDGATTLSGALDVTGSATLSDTLSVAGNIRLQGQMRQGALGDLAEMMPLARCVLEPPDIKVWQGEAVKTNLPLFNKDYYDALFTAPGPADVVVISPQGGVRRSFEPAAKNIAGIVSTNPAQVLHDDLPQAVPVALSGVVPCKVTDENGAIFPGDLLVSSSLPGYAMKAPESPAPGTVVAKALEPLAQERGIIKALIFTH